ncbi:MAG: aminopeptidase [Syntrophobacterales bacterium]|jgi:aminopeptidase|nr:aminopeptidase [Syntrophobacterales bacterium]
MTLTAEQLERYADVLLWGMKTARVTPFRKGNIVLLQYDLAALPLAEILFERLIDLGLHTIQRMAMTSRMEKSFYTKADTRQLTFLSPGDKPTYKKLDGRIFLRAPDSLTHLAAVDPQNIAQAVVARKPLRELMDKREQKRLHGWTLCLLPTPELAAQAQLSLEEYTAQIVKACYLDYADPVSKWQDIYREISVIKQWLDAMDVKHFHIDAEHIDLDINPGESRRWLGVSGHNIPSFELFLSPDWRGTEGVFYANQPSYRHGNYVAGVRLFFEQGHVVKAEVEQGEAFTKKQIAMDEGARRVGEFSLTDRRFSRIDRFMADTLFDENYGGDHGNCHIALGSSYADTFAGDMAQLDDAMKKTLGFNESALHWDLVNTEQKVVTAVLTTGERKVIYEDGMFRY